MDDKRALECAIADDIFEALTGHYSVPDCSDLRPARRAKNLTFTAAAEHLGVCASRVGELELGRAPTTTPPTATANGSPPLDTQYEHQPQT